jgi:hypothetical protein
MDKEMDNPTHRKNPTHPVTLEGVGTFCNCDECHNARQTWANNSEPMIDDLPQNDMEDDLWQDIGGEG